MRFMISTFICSGLYKSRRMASEWDVATVSWIIEREGISYDDATVYLNGIYGTRYCTRTLQRFCAKNGIVKREKVSTAELDRMVKQSIDLVGPTYGRKTMKGLISAQFSKNVAEKRVHASLKRVHPEYAEVRRRGIDRQLRPAVYVCAGFGQNVHVDQNEKLVHYSVVITMAIDGYSSFIPGYAVMSAKNNIVIYRDMFRPIVESYGVFKKVYADHGREFYLLGFMQQYFTHHIRGPAAVETSFIQTKSTSNVRIERCWVEVNRRVGYPLRCSFIDLETRGLADKDNAAHLFSMSIIGQWLTRYGVKIFVDAWNCHPIRGSWIPMEHIFVNTQSSPLPQQRLLSEADAANLYRQLVPNGTLAVVREGGGLDCLEGHFALQQLRDAAFCNISVPQMDNMVRRFHGHPITTAVSDYDRVAFVFGCVVNGNYRPMHHLILSHISISARIYRRYIQ